ncbi:MAG TPA: hypothetical protein VEI02_09090, partial [Planctomycetota bacterium]|nr:hypothetical protein [Planctomycetota bacterium]
MRPRFHDLSFAVVVLLAAAPSAFGQAGAGETPPVDPPPPPPTACYYVTWPMGGGDLAPMINGSGDDFAHAHALGPFCQGEARATNASMAAGDGDLKTWGVMHFAVPACPPVEFTATGRLGAMSSAAIDVGTGSRLARCETHQVLHSTALGQLEITTSASVGTAQSYQTTPPGAQFGLAAGRIVFDAATPVMLTRRMTT